MTILKINIKRKIMGNIILEEKLNKKTTPEIRKLAIKKDKKKKIKCRI